MAKSRPAFTLFEMCLVLAIMVVLAALAIPSMDAFFCEYRLHASSDAVRANWELARSHSMNEGRSYRFAVIYDKGNFRLAPDSPEFWGDGGGTTDQGENGGRAFERIGALPRGVRFRTTDFQAGGNAEGGESSLPLDGIETSQWVTLAVFLPDGSTREDVSVVLDSEGAMPLHLFMRSLTGTVTVRRHVADQLVP